MEFITFILLPINKPHWYTAQVCTKEFAVLSPSLYNSFVNHVISLDMVNKKVHFMDNYLHLDYQTHESALLNIDCIRMLLEDIRHTPETMHGCSMSAGYYMNPHTDTTIKNIILYINL